MATLTGHALVFDVTRPGSGLGYVPDGVDIQGRRENGLWLLYAGDQDQYHAEGRQLDQALKRLARVLGITGTAEVCHEYLNRQKVITL
jgi:hypothetical protein